MTIIGSTNYLDPATTIRFVTSIPTAFGFPLLLMTFIAFITLTMIRHFRQIINLFLICPNKFSQILFLIFLLDIFPDEVPYHID
jgi:hypothetical protein